MPSSTEPVAQQDPIEDEVRQLAYQLWEEAGRPDGRDIEFWDRAYAMLSSRPEPTED